MAHHICAILGHYLNGVDDQSVLLVELLQRICNDGHTCNTVGADAHALDTHSLGTQAVIIRQNALLAQLLKAFQVIEHTGFAVNKVICVSSEMDAFPVIRFRVYCVIPSGP